jgi:hypothetical protein
MSVLLWACASGGGPQSKIAVLDHDVATQADSASLARRGQDKAAFKAAQHEWAAKSAGDRNAKTSAGEQTCKPLPGAEPKIVTSEGSVSDVADTGRALIFDVAGIALELPACTPGADARVITVSWDTKGRPNATRIHPKFVRHAATLRVDQVIVASDTAPLLVRLHSKRELAKSGEKLVLAVESSGECDAAHKHEKLEDGDCSHWQLFDAAFDAQRNEMVASIPATGGYRLQFGWVPAK